MTTEDSSTSTPDVNPYWAAAQARLQEAGYTPKPETNMYPVYQQVPPPYAYFHTPYASAQMPSVAVADPYSWPTPAQQCMPPPPPPTRHTFHQPRPQRLDGSRPQRLDGSRVPFNYNAQQTPQHRQRFTMSFQRAQNGNVNRFGSSNPLVAAAAAQDDTLGDPNGGFFLRGKHPPALKLYVSRSLAHPKTSEERTKCENYLYSKIQPLILSGAVFHVQWPTEPLPHEKNYELTTSWTPASKLKPSSGSSSSDSRKSISKREPSFSHPYRMSGPDIALVAPPRSSLSSNSSSNPIIQRGKKKIKRKNDSLGSRFGDDEEDMYGTKRVKGEKFGTNHTENWLEDWIDSRKSKTRLSSLVNFMSLQERPYRRKANKPISDGSRLSRSFPKVLSNLGQDMVNEYFNRNEGRFDPNDCDEVIGTCYEIEKKFFRLTKKPEASEIRPLTVLTKAFNRLQTIARDPAKYKFVCDQLRSIRQDLTVQKIRNEFTVAVYEFHARLTLENKDLCEFNQCQSQLRHLYTDIPGCKNEYEFTAYRLLYHILTEDDQDILSLLNDMDSKARQSPSIALAIKVHDAYLKGHHIKLFKLYDNTPRMCGHVMDLFLDRERRKFIKIIRSSYHPFIEVSTLSNWFQFSREKEFVEYMKAQGIEIQLGGKTEPKKWPLKA